MDKERRSECANRDSCMDKKSELPSDDGNVAMTLQSRTDAKMSTIDLTNRENVAVIQGFLVNMSVCNKINDLGNRFVADCVCRSF